MTNTGQDFNLHRGRSRIIEYVIKDEDGGAVEHVGTEATWELSEGLGHDALVTKTNGSGIVVDQDPTAQTLRVRVTLASADTKDLAARAYRHELGISFPDGTEYVAATGKLDLQGTDLAPEAS